MKQSDGGSTSNDSLAGLGAARLDISQIGPSHNEFTLDVRDKYDSYGHLDDGSDRLVSSDIPELRQLVYKAPYVNHPLYWSVGRFFAADATVLANDGAEVGTHLNPKTRAGIYGGLYPEQRGGRTLKLSDEDHQAGVYAVYQDLSKAGEHNTYAASSLVLRQAVPGVASYDNPAAPLVGNVNTVGPQYVGNSTPAGNYLFWYTNIIHQPDPGTRYTYLAHVDIEPQIHLRDLWASAFQELSPTLAGTLSLFSLDLTEYQRQRDLLDSLAPSAFNEVKVDLRLKLKKTMLLDTEVFTGLRTADQKDTFGINSKVVMSNLLQGHADLFGGGGIIKNFVSRDLTIRGGGSYYSAKSEISGDLQYTIQNRTDQTVLHPLVATVSYGRTLNRSVLGSLTLEYASDEIATVMSVLATVGYRFSNKESVPIRDRAPRLERL